MKKLLTFLLFLAPVSLYCGIQNGITIPDSIELRNSSNTEIEVDGTRVTWNESIKLPTNTGSFTVKTHERTYKVTFPVYNAYSPIQEVYTSAALDFSTIQCIAGDLDKVFRQGLDCVAITNDTYYPIAAVYVLNQMRSGQRTIDPQDTISKTVSNTDNQKSGFIELIDENRKKFILKFPCRRYSRSGLDTCDWREITLKASTVAWFNKGFKVTSR